MTEEIKRLTRPRGGRQIAGVCAGIADFLNVDIALVRLVWVILSIVPGAIVGGVIAYLGAWIAMPEGAGTLSTPDLRRRLTRSSTNRKVAGVCGGIAEYFDIEATPVGLLWIVCSVLFGAVVGGAVIYLLAWLVMPKAAAPVLPAPAPAEP